jgi:transcriptional regulator with XRE-family HTH domain
MSLGGEIRRRRQALGFTLENLAERASLSPHFLSTVETDKRDPSVSTVRAIAKGLGCPPGELLGGVKDLTPAGYEAGKLYDAAAVDVQAGVLAILRATTSRRRR